MTRIRDRLLIKTYLYYTYFKGIQVPRENRETSKFFRYWAMKRLVRTKVTSSVMDITIDIVALEGD